MKGEKGGKVCTKSKLGSRRQEEFDETEGSKVCFFFPSPRRETQALIVPKRNPLKLRFLRYRVEGCVLRVRERDREEKKVIVQPIQSTSQARIP